MNYIKLLIIVFSLFISSSIMSQEKSTMSDEQWDLFLDELLKDAKLNPMLSLEYGLSNVSRSDLQVTQFADPALLELKLGYILERNALNTDNIIKQVTSYLYLSHESTSMSGNENSDETGSDMWRYGYGRTSGYGYKLGQNNAIIPYYAYTLNISNIDFNYPPNQTSPADSSDQDILNRYEGSGRFGSSSEAGIRLRAINNLMIEAGYEWSIVFERYLFWKWAGSALIEAVAQNALDLFVYDIFDSSPDYAPIIYFLLKNALAYGLYELRKDEMYWPFPSAASLSYDQFKFGITYSF